MNTYKSSYMMKINYSFSILPIDNLMKSNTHAHRLKYFYIWENITRSQEDAECRHV